MSNYIDFTDYNEEAENIRPTARIQLIQRIINAANLISSLSAGVPLKWAQAYKSFQVLKYVSGQDPLDVTSNEAISSVNSILYETENQLRASKDDMDTLKSELTQFEVTGQADLSKYDDIDDTYGFDDKYMLVESFNISGSTIYFCLKSDSAGRIQFDKLYAMQFATWQSVQSAHSGWPLSPSIMVSHSTLMGSNSWFGFKVCTFNKQVFSTELIKEAGGSAIQFTIAAGSSITNSNQLNYRRVLESEIVFGTDPIIEFNFGSTNSPLRTSGDVLSSETVTIEGAISPDEALGLPDPTGLINIINAMESGH